MPLAVQFEDSAVAKYLTRLKMLNDLPISNIRAVDVVPCYSKVKDEKFGRTII